MLAARHDDIPVILLKTLESGVDAMQSAPQDFCFTGWDITEVVLNGYPNKVAVYYSKIRS